MKYIECKSCTYLDKEEDYVCLQFGTEIRHIRDCDMVPETSFFFQDKDADQNPFAVLPMEDGHRITITYVRGTKEHKPYYDFHHVYVQDSVYHVQCKDDQSLIEQINVYFKVLQKNGINAPYRARKRFLHGK